MAALRNDPQNPHVQRYRKSRIFQDIWAKAARDRKTIDHVVSASEWFRKKAKEMGKDVAPEDLMSDESRMRVNYSYGKMYSYFYVPKHKDNIKVLPYYDVFPLVFAVGPAPQGFYGINLHYLAPTMRAALMDELFNLRNNDRFNDTTKLAISYSILKKASKLSAFQPCFKHYLTKYVYSKFMYIEPADWNIALFLPTERFIRATRQKVWQDSRGKIK